MQNEIGGWLWAFIDIILVVALGGALVYASIMWRKWRQQPKASEERERKTRELFERE